MPTYAFDLDGKKHTFTTDHDLSDDELSAAIGQLSSPETPAAAPVAPPPGVPTKSAPPPANRVPDPTNEQDPDAGRFILNLPTAIAAQTNRLAAGVGQFGERVVNALGGALGVPEDKQTHVFTNMGDRATEVLNRLERENAGISGAAGVVPMVAGGAAVPAAGAVGALGRVGQAAGAGALAGAAEPVPSGQDFATGKATSMAEGAAISGGVAAAGEALSPIKRKAGEILFGHTGDVNSPVRALAKTAEDMGFKINPQQRREDAGRLQTAGLSFADREQNTLRANEIASAATGQGTNKITSEYLGERFKDLGSQFDKIYAPGKTYKIDASVVPKLQAMVQSEQALGRPWQASEAVTAANKIIDSVQAQQGAAGSGRITAIKVPAEDIQRLRTEISRSANKTKDNFDKDALLEVVDSIDSSVEKNHPEVADALKELRPKYRSLVTLDTLAKSGGIDPNGNISPARLGEYLRKKDPNYTKDKSTHPLAALGEVGETFGIRGMNESNVIGGGATARARPEDVASHTGRWRMAMEHARDLPVVKQAMQSGYENKIYSMSGYGLTQDELRAINATMLTMQDEERKREATNR